METPVAEPVAGPLRKTASCPHASSDDLPIGGPPDLVASLSKEGSNGLPPRPLQA